MKFLRIAWRLAWLAGEVVLALARFALLPNRRFDARAEWLCQACRRVVRVLGLRMRCAGIVPRSGLLVSNHLSYLDIIVLGAAMPAVFVAKREVKSWPVFGWLASLAGTVFVDRTRARAVTRVNARMSTLLDNGALVVLFPESTTSDGRTVLPFKSSLLESAQNRHAVTAGCISYFVPNGDVANEVCYWRDMTLFPHLLNLLGKAEIEASVCFNEIETGSMDRKSLAQELHSEVLRLKASGSPAWDCARQSLSVAAAEETNGSTRMLSCAPRTSLTVTPARANSLQP